MEMVRQFIPLLLPAQGTIVNIGSRCYSISIHSSDARWRVNNCYFRYSRSHALPLDSSIQRIESRPCPVFGNTSSGTWAAKHQRCDGGNGTSELESSYTSTTWWELDLQALGAGVSRENKGAPRYMLHLQFRSCIWEESWNHSIEAMSPEIYAAALVTHVTGHSPSPWFWKGTNVTVTWIISTFAPKRAFVSYGSTLQRPNTHYGIKDTLMKRLSGLGNARDDILQRALEVWSKCDWSRCSFLGIYVRFLVDPGFLSTSSLPPLYFPFLRLSLYTLYTARHGSNLEINVSLNKPFLTPARILEVQPIYENFSMGNSQCIVIFDIVVTSLTLVANYGVFNLRVVFTGFRIPVLDIKVNKFWNFADGYWKPTIISLPETVGVAIPSLGGWLSVWDKRAT